ncbi:MAG TPA: hypothetical protein VFG72_03405 [Marmoricola sp.]|nr:hypothetical protein [Marmoricola sp.]
MRSEGVDAASAGVPVKRAAGARGRAGAAVVAALKDVPLSPAMRRRLHETLPWRPGVTEIPVDRLLLGLQNRMRADDFAHEYGELSWPSTPVGEGPHAELLRLAATHGDLDAGAILDSSYGRLARVCIRTRGFFFTATDEQGIVDVAHNYIGRHRGRQVAALGEHQSPAGAPIRVAPIRWSECYQVLDGHHRVASAIVRGAPSLTARVKWRPLTTPLQRLLIQMSPPGGRTLLQPVDAPEVGVWSRGEGVGSTVAHFDAMERFLASPRFSSAPLSSYLDVGSVYGWRVAQMAARGYRAEGVEDHPAAMELAQAAYGLEPGQVHRADPVRFLSSGDRSWDVVSWSGPSEVGPQVSDPPDDLLALLTRRTGRALFLPRGSQRLERLLRREFDEVTVVEDTDARTWLPASGLLACVRSGAESAP